eukprot:3134779-Pyramimonas_sp.AAC.1
MAAILGGYGMVAYAAANAFMDAFAHERADDLTQEDSSASAHASSKPLWRSVNWDDWAFEYGKEQTGAYELTGTAAFAIRPEEGFEALKRVLASPHPQVTIGTPRGAR